MTLGGSLRFARWKRRFPFSGFGFPQSRSRSDGFGFPVSGFRSQKDQRARVKGLAWGVVEARVPFSGFLRGKIKGLHVKGLAAAL